MSAATGLKTTTVKSPEVLAPVTAVLAGLRATARSLGRTDLETRLELAGSRVTDPRVRLAVIGESGAGMSTLVNSLVGAPVSATAGHPSVPVVVEYGPRPSATLVRAGAEGVQRQSVDPLNPGPALQMRDVIRAEFAQPSPLLADGLVVMDAPGAAVHDSPAWSMIAAADAVLYVADAARELTPSQLDHLRRIQQICPAVICVLSRIDRHPNWARVQQRNRDLLDKAGLEFAVAPVSAVRHRAAVQARDPQSDIGTGVPQLIDHLRESVVARADELAVTAAATDAERIAELMQRAVQAETETLRDPRRTAEVTEQLTAARAEAEALRQRSAAWQLVLADGNAELLGDIEHDLRHRLRGLVRESESTIGSRDPARRWDEFGADLDSRICAEVEENFVMAHYRAVQLSEQVAATFPPDDRTPPQPELRLDEPGEVLEPVQALGPLDSAAPERLQQLLATMRGFYGGLLMIGVATNALLDMNLVNWYSAGAGVLLGLSGLWDDRRSRKQRRQAEAKVAVARLADDVVFQVGKESRDRLRAMQRDLRDHYTRIASEAQRAADDALRAADESSRRFSAESAERLARLDAAHDTLRTLRDRAHTLTLPQR